MVPSSDSSQPVPGSAYNTQAIENLLVFNSFLETFTLTKGVSCLKIQCCLICPSDNVSDFPTLKKRAVKDQINGVIEAHSCPFGPDSVAFMLHDQIRLLVSTFYK